MLKNIFGDYIWIVKLDDDFVKEYEESFNEDSKNGIDTGSWSKCNVTSSYFNKEIIKNVKKIDYNGKFSIILKNELEKFMNELSKFQEYKIDINFQIDSFWYNIYEMGDFQEIHDHSGKDSFYSFVYLLKSNNMDLDSELIFDNPRGSLFKLNNFNDMLDGIDNYKVDYKPDLSKGDLIIFPSHMKHYVSLHKNKNDTRITIAGNISTKL